MKKVFTFLLALISAVCVLSAATAQEVKIHQENGSFYIVIAPPNGARVVRSTTEDHFTRTDLAYITEGKPSVTITVAGDDLYFGLNLSDLSSDGVDLIINEVTVEMSEPGVDIYKTPAGYEYIVANETTEGNDACDTLMLVNGYFIMVHVFYDNYTELTEQDMEIGPDIVNTLRFVGNTNT
jgi:hypothetical protein